MGNLSEIPADDIYYTGSSPSDTDPLIDWGFVTTPQAVSINLHMVVFVAERSNS